VRLIVTGGAGFIGSAFVRLRLAETDDSVIVLDKLTYAGNRDNLADVEADPTLAGRYRFVHGDIADPALVGELVAASDAIVNFAAESHVDRSILDPSTFIRTGVTGVHTLLEAIRDMREQQGVAQRLVQVSTDEVYGSLLEGQRREEDALDPQSPYSAVKAAGELLTRAYRSTYGIDVVITRGANTYGPRQHPEKLVALFVTNALCDEPLPLYGDGLHRRDWLYVDDHARGVAMALDRGEPGATYNISARGEHTNREVTKRILDELGKPWSLVRSVPDRPGHDRRYAVDASRMRALGWSPVVTFEEGISRTVRWYAENERWWRAARSGEWADYYMRQYGWRLEQSIEA
jgi:dTDP-glucose 4,6-dehydratase